LKFQSSATKATLFHFMSLAGLYLKEHKTVSAETQGQTIPNTSAFTQPDETGYRQPVTESDRKQVFSYMANKNPKLSKLANRLGLDT